MRWIGALAMQDGMILEEAATKLSERPSTAVPALIAALERGIGVAAGPLVRIGSPDGDPAVPLLIANLASSDVVSRRWAALALGQFPDHAGQSVPALSLALTDTDRKQGPGLPVEAGTP